LWSGLRHDEEERFGGREKKKGGNRRWAKEKPQLIKGRPEEICSPEEVKTHVTQIKFTGM